MKRKLFLIIVCLIFFVSFLKTAEAQARTVVFSEIMYDLEGSDEKREWLEIFNNSAAAIDLSDWKLFEDGTNHKLTGNLLLPAAGYAVVVSDEAAFRSEHPGFSGLLLDSSFSLKNSGEYLALKDKALNTIDELTYDPLLGGQGNDHSLEKVNNLWQESLLVAGTPGRENSATSQELPPPAPATTGSETPITTNGDDGASLAQNQAPIAQAGEDITALVGAPILFDGSKSKDPEGQPLTFYWNFGDAKTSAEVSPKHSFEFPGKYLTTLKVSDGKNEASDILLITIYPRDLFINEINPEEKWLELKNESSLLLDISGWKINGFTLPEQSLIASGQYLTLAGVETGESVKLFYPNNEVAQEINFKEIKKHQSINRLPGNEYAWSAITTPGGTNFFRALDKKIISANLGASLASLLVQETPQKTKISFIGKNQAWLALDTAKPSPENQTQIERSEPNKFLESLNKIIPAVGIALILGVIFGWLLGRRKRDKK